VSHAAGRRRERLRSRAKEHENGLLLVGMGVVSNDRTEFDVAANRFRPASQPSLQIRHHDADRGEFSIHGRNIAGHGISPISNRCSGGER